MDFFESNGIDDAYLLRLCDVRCAGRGQRLGNHTVHDYRHGRCMAVLEEIGRL